MDNGLPFTTEPNSLVEMITPTNILKKMVGGMIGQSNVSGVLPDGSLSNTPWRKTGVRYATNEIYFDIIEEIDCTIDANGLVVFSEVSGEIQALSKLSGMPDLTLSFINPHILDDVSFHPCVRYNRYEQSKVISFVPPDGSFKLMNYRVKGQLQLPIYIKPQITAGRVSVMVGLKNTGGKAVEDVTLIVQFPKSITTASLTATFGTIQYDEQTKTAKWIIGKMPKEKSPQMDGTLSPSVTPETPTIITSEFKIVMYTASGLKVDSLSLQNEKYKPYKGVRSITKAGKFQVRT